MTFTFTAKLWLYSGKGAWVFATLPPDVAGQIRFVIGKTRGFGSVRVNAQIGATRWGTSVFPDKKTQSYLLPIKTDVRKREKIGAGDDVEVQLSLIDV